MTKKVTLAILAIMALCLSANADPIKIKGVYNNNRYDDHADHWYSTYVGWNSTLGKAIFVVENGIYAMEVEGNTVTTPEKEPAVVISDFYSNGQFTNDAMALWANNFNLMYGNSGAVKAGDRIVTVTSRSGDEVEDSERFAVRKWNAETGDLLNSPSEYHAKSEWLESAGMCVNPKDNKVYGLFYLTDVQLPDEIINDPDFFGDSIDSGYAICTIDLDNMVVTPITPGLYYDNFVTFAINSEGRAFAMTAGSTAGYEGEDGKFYDVNGNLTGAHVIEFDLASGLILNDLGATGYCSQAKRQSACFSMKNPNKMYWNGFVNSGMGYNDYGNWAPLPDNNWLNNGKYDTALYEVDLTTGETTRIAKIDNRFSFSCMWVVEDDEPINVVDGDVNGDGFVTSADITALYNWLLNEDDSAIVNGDQNKDGDITTGDVTYVYNILLNGGSK